MSTDTPTIAPARSRSAVDALFNALDHDSFKPLAKVVEATGLEREAVRAALAAGSAGAVCIGDNGKWSRAGVTRTKFRDQLVIGAVLQCQEKGAPPTLDEIAGVVPASRPQLYTSLARLQAAKRITPIRDGTRTPRYVADAA